MEPATLLTEYSSRVSELLNVALAAEATVLQRAAELIGATFNAGGLLYIFGSGHSHIFAEEAFYRAGGAARVCPVLQSAHMLHEGAVRSSELERESGHGEPLLATYQLDGSRDCMLVASNSGANALPIEVATAAKERGLPVIAITSLDYAKAIDRPGPRLYEIADLVVDNHCPPGDALVELGPGLPGTGPGSSVVGLALLNAMIVGALEHQVASGRRPDVFVSANMPGAAEHNATVVREFAPIVPHL
jgi:uncharacterized phosphosugar-binding protein